VERGVVGFIVQNVRTELSSVEAVHSTTHYGEAQCDTDSIYILLNMLINVCRRSTSTHSRPGLKKYRGEKNKINILFSIHLIVD
jgi:hypothetical protein